MFGDLFRTIWSKPGQLSLEQLSLAKDREERGRGVETRMKAKGWIRQDKMR